MLEMRGSLFIGLLIFGAQIDNSSNSKQFSACHMARSSLRQGLQGRLKASQPIVILDGNHWWQFQSLWWVNPSGDSLNIKIKLGMIYYAQVSGDMFETDFLPICIDFWPFLSIEIESFTSIVDDFNKIGFLGKRLRRPWLFFANSTSNSTFTRQ
jgi:hypothetical protein